MTDGLTQPTQEDELSCCICGGEVDGSYSFEDKSYCELCYYVEVTKCEACGVEMLSDEAQLVETKPYCATCYDDLFTHCVHCNEVILVEDARDSEDGSLCEDCRDEHYFACDDCGRVYRDDDSIHTASDYLICERCYHNNYFTCDDCGEVLHVDDYEEDGVCRTCYRDNRRNSDPECSDDEDRPDDTVSARRASGLKGKRTVGVEIECYPSSSDESSYRSYRRRCSLSSRRWDETDDGSLSRGGAEFVSPIMSQDKYRDMIFDFCNNVIPEAVVDRRCGTHIHLDSRDLSWWNLANLHAYCYNYEDDFFSLVAPSRDGNQYSSRLPEPPDASKKQDVTKAYYGHGKMELQKGCKYPRHSYGVISRYWWLNIHAHFYQRTIEVRLHHGTTNPEKISNWIALWLEILPIACGNPKNWKPPLELLSPDLKAYWTARKAKFSSRRAA